MKTVLSAVIPVTRVAVFAEMAFMERRPELGLLCRSARDTGKRITAAVVQSVVPGLSDAGASNVIAWCRSLGLCDGNGGLTSLAEAVASSDTAPVPEQGVYDLWIAQHAVIGRRVLGAERLAARADKRFESIKPVLVEPDRDRLFRSVVDGKTQFVVRDLPANHNQPGGIARETQATCKLRWTLDFDQERDQWQLEGTIEVPQGKGKHNLQAIKHEPESDGLDLWKLADSWATGPFASFGRWQAKERRLAVAFDGLTDAEINHFRKTIALRRVEVPGKGEYENVTIEDVPIAPVTAKDAQKWAMSRFDHYFASNPSYRSRSDVRTLYAQLTEDTPLESHAPTLASHEELLSRAAKDPERFWSLAAPVDLAPVSVSSSELGEFRVGTPEPAEISVPSNVVRVPYRGGWSMRRLVDQLIARTVPRRVLLCDRFVRGEDNLQTLKVLVATLRIMTANASIEVWTGNEEADFKKIQAITGTQPCSYQEVFGRSLPHDRYLLVIPSEGQGFGWHMSNSPLHARPSVQEAGPDSPLRWKDLAATRVTADELLPALRQWLERGGQ